MAVGLEQFYTRQKGEPCCVSSLRFVYLGFTFVSQESKEIQSNLMRFAEIISRFGSLRSFREWHTNQKKNRSLCDDGAGPDEFVVSSDAASIMMDDFAYGISKRRLALEITAERSSCT